MIGDGGSSGGSGAGDAGDAGEADDFLRFEVDFIKDSGMSSICSRDHFWTEPLAIRTVQKHWLWSSPDSRMSTTEGSRRKARLIFAEAPRRSRRIVDDGKMFEIWNYQKKKKR